MEALLRAAAEAAASVSSVIWAAAVMAAPAREVKEARVAMEAGAGV